MQRSEITAYHAAVEGQIASGINNIYRVRLVPSGQQREADAGGGAGDGGGTGGAGDATRGGVRGLPRIVECRLKGKVLGGPDRTRDPAYNPLAPGDWVEVTLDPNSPENGWITDRRARSSAVRRWNRKRQAPQTIAANVDRLLAVGSFAAPPFRPRFLDRLLLCAELGDVQPAVVINKADLGSNPAIEQRLACYRRMGYTVVTCSAASGSGLEPLRELLAGAVLPALVGQSGVGKSALLNRLDPTLNRTEAALSRKYDRGVHTTRYGEIVQTREGVLAIDTPGIRELEITDIEPHELRLWFRDFLPYVEECTFPGCLCMSEPGCAVRAACDRGEIHADRYVTYRGILQELQDAAAARR